MTAPGLRGINRERLDLGAHNLLRRLARRAGLDLVRADFNSPVVDPRRLPAAGMEQPASMPGVELDLDLQLEFLQHRLSPFLPEFRPPLLPQRDPLELYLENRWYGPMDAHVLYAMLRHLRPSRVLELGSGYSTLIIHEALERNSADGDRVSHELADPYPSPLLLAVAEDISLHAQSAAVVDANQFAQLRAGDVLFVDTTHVVRPDGEVVRLVLEVLPSLAPGVYVHFHDIFRPYGYPRVLYERYNVHWQEQYLLQAFLAYNPNFAIVCANHALWRLRRPRVTQLFPTLRPEMQPSAFWLKCRGG